jgi:hypothetical protein
MSAPGAVHLVGVGPGDEESLSIGAADAIHRATEIWMLELGPDRFERPQVRERLVGKRVVNLYGYYLLPACPRLPFYQLIARRMAHLAVRGRRLTFVLSGNPAYWVYISSLLKRYVRTRRFDLRSTYSMSFLDTMYDPTPFTCLDGLQVRLGTITGPDVSPDLDCIVGQIHDAGTSDMVSWRAVARFCRTVRRIYPPAHPIHVVGNHSVDGSPVHRPTTVEHLEGAVRDLTDYHYSLLIPSRAQVATYRKSAEDNRDDERLAYLIR